MFLQGGQCEIYPARPLICRTQGLPLAYPSGFVDAAAVSAKTTDGREIVWCPLNFTSSGPKSADVLDAAKADEALAHINLSYCQTRQIDPLQRHALRQIAADVS